MPFDFEDLENSKILEFVLSIFFRNLQRGMGNFWKNLEELQIEIEKHF